MFGGVGEPEASGVRGDAHIQGAVNLRTRGALQQPQQLPDDFQTAEFMLQNGFVDMIVDRKSMRSTLSKIFRMHNYKKEKEKGENQ